LKVGVSVYEVDLSRKFGNLNSCIIDVLMINYKLKNPICNMFLHLDSFYSDNFSRFSRKIVGLFPVFKNKRSRQFFHNLLIKTGVERVNGWNQETVIMEL
jgi:hypothetical protein